VIDAQRRRLRVVWISSTSAWPRKPPRKIVGAHLRSRAAIHLPPGHPSKVPGRRAASRPPLLKSETRSTSASSPTPSRFLAGEEEALDACAAPPAVRRGTVPLGPTVDTVAAASVVGDQDDAERFARALVMVAEAFAGAGVETAELFIAALDRVALRRREVVAGAEAPCSEAGARTRRPSASVAGAGTQDVSRGACAGSWRGKAVCAGALESVLRERSAVGPQSHGRRPMLGRDASHAVLGNRATGCHCVGSSKAGSPRRLLFLVVRVGRASRSG
jgi:hypothetical protein